MTQLDGKSKNITLTANAIERKLYSQIQSTVNEGRKVCSERLDIYEYISFNNLTRHYTFSDVLAINSNIEHITISFENDLYDFYQKIPSKYRFDSRVQRTALGKINPSFANLISANTTYPIKYSMYKKFFIQVINFFNVNKKNFKGNEFERMGLPLNYLIKHDWKSFLLDIVKSKRLSSIKFLDKKKVDSYIKKSLKQKNPGNDQFLMMLITIDQFIKVIK